MNMKGLWIIILIISSQLGIRLHQRLLADGVLNLHLGLASDIDAWLQNDLSEQAAKGETGIALISGLQDNSQNMLAQAEGQAQVNDIDKLCLLQNEVIAPSNKPYIVQDDLGKNAVRSRQDIDLDGSGTLLTLRDSLEKFSEII
jgi:hypothetical protein